MKGRPPHHFQRDRKQRPSDAAPGDDIEIFGLHAVEAALANPRRVIRRLQATDNAENRLAPLLAERGIKCSRINPRDLDRRLGADTVHQGVLLETVVLDVPTLADIAADTTRTGPIVVLDQVTDPHNVGAILRSSAAFGARGLVMTTRNSPRLSGVLAKAASGALEHVPVALVVNLARALAELADLGFERIGLDGEADEAIETVELGTTTALVLGAEGRGLRRLTRESCDRLCRISTRGPIGSLNVSTAAAVALHWCAMGRTMAAEPRDQA
jgi:23S rRNA (guanosine2251-2'-O)-methyltransferase